MANYIYISMCHIGLYGKLKAMNKLNHMTFLKKSLYGKFLFQTKLVNKKVTFFDNNLID